MSTFAFTLNEMGDVRGLQAGKRGTRLTSLPKGWLWLLGGEGTIGAKGGSREAIKRPLSSPQRRHDSSAH